MGWRIGDWQDFEEGQIHQITKRCVRLLHDKGFSMEVDFAMEKKKIHFGRPEGGFFEILKEYEQDKGIAVLLGVLICGVVILKAKKNNCEIDLQLLLRNPEESQEKAELFKAMIISWVKEDTLSFTERFFRLPKICEDITDRYLDNSLEQVLRKTFGFHFKYKLIISSPEDSVESRKLREALYFITLSPILKE